ncbi:GTP 3',8-cyclase MoaA [Emcibacter nanhaiensis]|uniref:GTP 3',8-cyclase n=1 Tax=Emcibacter nanhaiensis TaxID=1505037 RepID=A0A501PQ77_9PROT|nr:GTP 3',8-cyclase MoaA [Emcibacter nanhaiensis]TPD62593.1 GTP 3',8-cyclase MoaA [Emcibacter nanhaiensis]
MIDPFGRHITYLRLSVTDRCDFRCQYCMAENMQFLPKSDVLSLEELEILCTAFIANGVKKIRLTGGEPLVRKNMMSLIDNLGQYVKDNIIEELTLTTNGSQLAKYASGLYEAGVRRINVSVDTLDEAKFRHITRWGNLDQVLHGIRAAQDAGLAIKINMVALKGINDDEIGQMLDWCVRNQMDLTLIETMPLGEIDVNRHEQYLSLQQVREQLADSWELAESDYRTGGPARYYSVGSSGRKLGMITPMSHNFCDSCNRIRVTCTGQLFMCLGHEDNIDLREVLRNHQGDRQAVEQAIISAISKKPERHYFTIDPEHNRPTLQRHMSMTGG